MTDKNTNKKEIVLYDNDCLLGYKFNSTDEAIIRLPNGEEHNLGNLDEASELYWRTVVDFVNGLDILRSNPAQIVGLSASGSAVNVEFMMKTTTSDLIQVISNSKCDRSLLSYL